MKKFKVPARVVLVGKVLLFAGPILAFILLLLFYRPKANNTFSSVSDPAHGIPTRSLTQPTATVEPSPTATKAPEPESFDFFGARETADGKPRPLVTGISAVMPNKQLTQVPHLKRDVQITRK